MTAAILFIFIIVVLYTYAVESVANLTQAARFTGKMLLLVFSAILIFGLLVYSFIKFGRIL